MADRPISIGFPSFSIVINTYNREPELRQTLEALTWLRYPGEFEVIVVNGPSTDGTEELLETWADRVVVGHVQDRNISVSRNEGIRLSAGDIVAFIDDDAIPEPRWLTELAAYYDDPSVGAVGGFVLDHSGHTFQYRFGSVDRMGDGMSNLSESRRDWCYPGSWRIAHLLGTNASYRRSALIEVGGYDEFYEYYLDETDVQIRLVDAGYVVAQTPRARVHHHFAPSHVRNAARVTRDWYPVFKNRLYFSLRYAREYVSVDEILQNFHGFVEKFRVAMLEDVAEGRLVETDRERFEEDAERALEAGLRAGLVASEAPRYDVAGSRPSLLQVRTRPQSDAMRIALVTSEYPPTQFGGIGTFTRDLAGGLADHGHEVHVITSGDWDHVEWEDGVWVHRIALDLEKAQGDPLRGDVPAQLWAWSTACTRELGLVEAVGPIDVYEAPIWDSQGIALLRSGRAPLVVSLQTTLASWLKLHPAQRGDETWMREFGAGALAAEAEVLKGADCVKAISHAVLRDVEDDYSVSFESRAVVAPLGIKIRQRSLGPGHSARVARVPGQVNILFVGRLEERKAVDVLLAAFAKACAEEPSLRLFLAGDDAIPWGDTGRPFRDISPFQEMIGDLGGSIHILGTVSEAQLDLAYENADIFVAPSRYESFGLVFVEAMARGLPVVGTTVGGVPEVVRNGIDGVLVSSDDIDELAAALLSLGRDPELRASMGSGGRERYWQHFTRDSMVERAEAIYYSLTDRAEVGTR